MMVMVVMVMIRVMMVMLMGSERRASKHHQEQ
jgi:uncharacterized membrane protein